MCPIRYTESHTYTDGNTNAYAYSNNNTDAERNPKSCSHTQRPPDSAVTPNSAAMSSVNRDLKIVVPFLIS